MLTIPYPHWQEPHTLCHILCYNDFVTVSCYSQGKNIFIGQINCFSLQTVVTYGNIIIFLSRFILFSYSDTESYYLITFDSTPFAILLLYYLSIYFLLPCLYLDQLHVFKFIHPNNAALCELCNCC